MDLDKYYRPDHPGRGHLDEILLYSRAHQQLTPAERQFCVNYHATGIEHIQNRTLHTLQNKPFMDFNFRGGWDAISGTLREVFTVVCWNNNVTYTKFRIPLGQTEQEQLGGQDLFAMNPDWCGKYNVQVKPLHLGSYDDLKINETRLCGYDPEFVHRLVLADVRNLQLYQFDYKEFLEHYKNNKIIGGFLDIKKMKSEMNHFVYLTL